MNDSTIPMEVSGWLTEVLLQREWFVVMQAWSLGAIFITLVGIHFLLRWKERPVRKQQSYTFLQEVHDPVGSIKTYFLMLFLFWSFFYLIPAYDGLWKSRLHPHTITLIEHVVQNMATWCLLKIYEILASPKKLGLKSREFARVVSFAWAFLALAAFCLEVLVLAQLQWQREPSVALKGFTLIYGMAQSLGLFLVGGRLEDAVIMDHFRRTRRNKDLVVWIYRFLVGFIFMYAAIQPMYIYFSGTQHVRVVSLLVFAAFLFKLALICLFGMLLYRKRDGINALEAYVYEVDRFVTEDLRSYVMEFFRQYLPTRYEELLRRKGAGYLGIDYIYPAFYKLMRLHLAQDMNNRIGGLLVKKVHCGFDTLHKGLRIGDYVTHVNGLPLGKNNTLLALLDNHGPGSEVDLTLLRLKDSVEVPTRADDYSECVITARLGTIDHLLDVPHPKDPLLPYLGIEFVQNHPVEGLMCRTVEEGVVDGKPKGHVLHLCSIKSSVTGQRYVLSDQQALRFAVRQCVPGETIQLGRVGDTDIGCKVRLTMEKHGVIASSQSVGVVQTSHIKGTDPSRIRKIVRAHPHRFVHHDATAFIQAPRSDPFGALLSAGLPISLLMFDKDQHLLFECVVPTARILEKLDDSSIWSHLDPGTHYFFVGPCPIATKGTLGTDEHLFVRGLFFDAAIHRYPKVATVSSNATV